MGPAGERGTGLIPKGGQLGRVPRTARATPDAIDFAEVRHETGGTSRLLFKAYEQGRESFQSAKIDVGLLDEKPPLSIYTKF
jgi:hypothetical protein